MDGLQPRREQPKELCLDSARPPRYHHRWQPFTVGERPGSCKEITCPRLRILSSSNAWSGCETSGRRRRVGELGSAVPDPACHARDVDDGGIEQAFDSEQRVAGVLGVNTNEPGGQRKYAVVRGAQLGLPSYLPRPTDGKGVTTNKEQ